MYHSSRVQYSNGFSTRYALLGVSCRAGTAGHHVKGDSTSCSNVWHGIMITTDRCSANLKGGVVRDASRNMLNVMLVCASKHDTVSTLR